MLKRVLVYLWWPETAEAFLPMIGKCREEQIRMHFDAWPAKPDLSDDETLYIIDHPDLRAVFAEKPVLGYLHEKNQTLSFGETAYLMEKPEEVEPLFFKRVYDRFYDLPWKILETKRCIIRESTAEDVPAFFRIYSEEITRYIEKLYPTPEEEMRYINDYRQTAYRFYEHGIWTVVDRESGAVIGRAGIDFREGFAEPEVGFLLAKEYQGKGIATEIMQAILSYGTEQFGYETYLAFVHPENACSLHLCRKLGFRLIGNAGLSRTNQKEQDSFDESELLLLKYTITDKSREA